MPGVSRECRDGRLRPRPQCRVLEPEVLRLPQTRGPDVVARGSWPDRGHRDLAPIHRQGQRRRRQCSARRSTRASRDVPAALNRLAAWLRSRYAGARVVGVGHRVVHGGATYGVPVVVTPEVIDDLRALIPLAPLHQPYNLAAIEAVADRLPGVPQVACFDTSFHRAQSGVAQADAASPRSPARRNPALRLPWAVVRVHRLGPARGGA